MLLLLSSARCGAGQEVKCDAAPKTSTIALNRLRRGSLRAGGESLPVQQLSLRARESGKVGRQGRGGCRRLRLRARRRCRGCGGPAAAATEAAHLLRLVRRRLLTSSPSGSSRPGRLRRLLPCVGSCRWRLHPSPKPGPPPLRRRAAERLSPPRWRADALLLGPRVDRPRARECLPAGGLPRRRRRPCVRVLAARAKAERAAAPERAEAAGCWRVHPWLLVLRARSPVGTPIHLLIIRRRCHRYCGRRLVLWASGCPVVHPRRPLIINTGILLTRQERRRRGGAPERRNGQVRAIAEEKLQERQPL